MKALGPRPVQLTFAILATTMIAVALLLLSSGSTEASHGSTTESSYNVTYAASVADKTPGVDRALTTVFTVPFPDNINFSSLIQFDPAATITQTCDTAPGWVEGDLSTTHTGGGACLTSTDQVGTISNVAYLGTSNNSCGTAGAITIDFDLFAVPTPNNVADPRASTNIAYTQPEGSGSRFGRWGWASDKALPADDFIPFFGGTSVIYQAPSFVKAAADNIMFKGYPEYLLDLFSTGGDGGTPLVPLAVYGSLTKIAGTPVPLYFVYFNPGDLAAEFSAPNPLGRATANLGFASTTVLNDPTQVSGNPSSVTAFCSTTLTTVLSATVGGTSRSTNPDGVPCTTTGCTRLNLAWSASQRDLENDGVENAIDTCPAAVDLDGDPRVSGNDPDGDNIDAACDPDGGGFAGDDFDSDTWPNQQDNCPLVANAAQVDSELTLGVAPGYAAGRANDGGPLDDDLGDDCDSEIGPLAVTYNNLAHVITPSDTVANGRWQVRALVAPICYGSAAVDADGDGYCASDADWWDGDATRHASWMHTGVLRTVLGVTYGAGTGSWDTDGGNATGSGYDSDWLETYIGTDAGQPCSLSATGLDPVLPDEPLGAYIFDYNTDQNVNFGDILSVAPVFGAPATTALGIRFDWNADGFVDLSDILSIAPAFGGACTPIVQPQ